MERPQIAETADFWLSLSIIRNAWGFWRFGPCRAVCNAGGQSIIQATLPAYEWCFSP